MGFWVRLHPTSFFHGEIRDSRKYDVFVRGKQAVLFIILLGKGLTQEINGDGGSIWWAPDLTWTLHAVFINYSTHWKCFTLLKMWLKVERSSPQFINLDSLRTKRNENWTRWGSLFSIPIWLVYVIFRGGRTKDLVRKIYFRILSKTLVPKFN